jgi:hypothetical protein
VTGLAEGSRLLHRRVALGDPSLTNDITSELRCTVEGELTVASF